MVRRLSSRLMRVILCPIELLLGTFHNPPWRSWLRRVSMALWRKAWPVLLKTNFSTAIVESA